MLRSFRVSPPRKSRVPIKLILVVVFVGAAIALFASGLHRDIDPEQVRQWLTHSGPWGPIVFLLAFALLQPLGVASHLFILSAAAVWHPAFAFGLSWLGAIGGGCTAFFFARYVGRGWVQDRMPKRLQGYDDRLETRGFRTVLGLRLLLFTFGPLQLMLGVSRVRFGAFVAGTAIGIAPMVAFETFVGGSIIGWVTSAVG